jgi:hypothetical protein
MPSAAGGMVIAPAMSGIGSSIAVNPAIQVAAQASREGGAGVIPDYRKDKNNKDSEYDRILQQEVEHFPSEMRDLPVLEPKIATMPLVRSVPSGNPPSISSGGYSGNLPPSIAKGSRIIPSSNLPPSIALKARVQQKLNTLPYYIDTKPIPIKRVVHSNKRTKSKSQSSRNVIMGVG